MLVAFAACKPLYGDPADPLKKPVPVKAPDDPIAVAPPPAYELECQFGALVQPPVARNAREAEQHKRDAEQRTAEGDQKLADYDAAPETKREDILTDGIDKYIAALRKDPFNAKATLALARAYDKAHRKGCALLLLSRLDKLAQNPKFAKAANEAIDEVTLYKRKWFGDYRKEAMRAVGRPGEP
jgi:hypothetical protein